MREEHRLRALEVRVAGEHRLALAVGKREQARDHGIGLAPPLGELLEGPQPEVRRDLVVAASAGVQLLAEIAHARHELALDPRVHILVGCLLERLRALSRVLEHVLERGQQGTQLVGRDDACTRDRARPGCASLDVLAHETAVEGKRIVEAPEEGVALRGEASSPEPGRSGRCGSRHRVCSSAGRQRRGPCDAWAIALSVRMREGSENSRMKPSA